MSKVSKTIELLVMDVDGTLTDGKIYIGEKGEVCKAFNIKDGYGICHLLPLIKVKPVIITGRQSAILENRCYELGITDLHQNISNKKELLLELSLGEADKIAYIGDDLNDYECMKWVKEGGGIVGCPADAVDQVIEIADFVSKKNGGCGAVRSYIEWLVSNISHNISK